MSGTKSFNISKQEVLEAWKCVKANQGSAGIDRVCIEAFEEDLKGNLYKIWNRMSSGTYFPPPVMAVEIPKKSGGTRVLGIPSVSDRVAQTVVKRRMEQILDPIFLPDSYGYRPNKSAIDAISVTKQRCWEAEWVLEFDIRGLFDNIRHDLLNKALSKHITEKWILLYVNRWLKAPMQKADGNVIQRDKGTPQGGCVSPVLSNLFLHYVFDLWMTRELPSMKWCRFADDGLIHCLTLKQAQFVLDLLKRRFEECGLQIHAGKTRIVYCSRMGKKSNHEINDFTFLGFTFCRRKGKNKTSGKIFDSFQPGISKEAVKSINHTIKYEWRLKRKTHIDLQAVGKLINPAIRGWFNYYGSFYREAMKVVARAIDRHLVIWIMNKHQKFHRSREKSYRWLKQICQGSPNLFAHWKYFPVY